MSRRHWVGVAVACVMFVTLLSATAALSLAAALPLAVSAATVAGLGIARPNPHGVWAWAAVVPGLVSIASTGWVLVLDRELGTAAGLWGMAEVVLLCVLLGGIVRWLTRWTLWVCGGLTIVAQVAWIARFVHDMGAGAVAAGCALWSVPSLVAVVVGGYPRLAAARLDRSVESARIEQRRALARDLHDYVAHDLTAMIVQAQAADYAAGNDPERLRTALRRIEGSGQRAMSSMDRALDLLSEDAEASGLRHPGLEELGELVAGFAEVHDVEVSFHDARAGVAPRVVSETLYRVCVEALTNVHRHAQATTRVDVDVDLNRRLVSVSVTNDGGAASSARQSRGSGLRNLRARVEALGGTFDASPTAGGWRVRATLPVDADA